MYNFFDSNLFQTVVIFLVGLFTFVIYKQQKKDEKIMIALTIMMEIRDIENKVSNIKNTDLTFTTIYDSKPILTQNYWIKHKQLFVRDFNQDEYKIINDFYDCAFRIEEERQILRNQVLNTLVEKQKGLQNNVCIIAKEIADDAKNNILLNSSEQIEFINRINNTFFLINHNTPIFIGDLPMNLIKSLAKDLPLVSTSTVGEKLNKFLKK